MPRSFPRLGACVRALASPSFYLALVAALLMLAAKIYAASRLGVPWPALVGAWAALVDLALFLGVGAVFAWLESRRPWLSLLTGPLAALLFLLAAGNAAYLAMAGEQGSWDALEDLWSRRRDAGLVLEEQLSDRRIAIFAAIFLPGLVSFPVGLRLALRRSSGGWLRPRDAISRSRAALLVAAASGALALLAPSPDDFESHKLGRSAIVGIVRGLVDPPGAGTGSFRGWAPERAVSPAQIEALARGERPDVLLIVLESTRYDHTSLSEDSRVKTPNLAGLAARGWSAPRSRAVLPHTTKSLFSILCGRLPTMQKGLIELSADAPAQCLPRILADAGYRTAFLQSAAGTFEQRPRLASKMGFEAFVGLEDTGSSLVGYLSSADSSLVKPTLAWIDEREGPFFATILTSGPHHPYRLSPAVETAAREKGLPITDTEDRYARLIEAEDRMLGRLFEGLRERGRLERTIVVVVGDHGEGFGDHGVLQHDNNFYEEGLRVPFVIAGPGVAPGRFDGNASLLDAAPTLMGLLGIDPDPGVLLGYDLLRAPPGPDVPRPFGCYRDLSCRGFVLGDHKVVAEPASGERWAYDLRRDPAEARTLRVDRALAEAADDLDRLINAHRIRGWKVTFAEVAGYPPWRCAAGKGALCLHPKAKKEKYRYTP